MPPELQELLDRAKSASGDELKALLHEPREEILSAIVENPHCEETHIVLLLERLDLSPNFVEAISRKTKWSSSEAVRLRLACHPRTPKRVASAAVRQLYLFDLVRVSFRARDPVRRFFPRVLKADLDVIETRIEQHLQSLLIESDA